MDRSTGPPMWEIINFQIIPSAPAQSERALAPKGFILDPISFFFYQIQSPKRFDFNVVDLIFILNVQVEICWQVPADSSPIPPAFGLSFKCCGAQPLQNENRSSSDFDG